MKEALVLLLLHTIFSAAGASSRLTVSLPRCPDKCGNVTIPYPFGIGAECAATSLSPHFTVTCNNTFQPARPMINDTSKLREVIDISLERGEMRLYGPVNHICFTSNTTTTDNHTEWVNLEGTPFVPSITRNRFTVIGCFAAGFLGGSNPDPYVTGCYTYCHGFNSTSSDGEPCTGKGCCETTISSNIKEFGGLFVTNQSLAWKFNPCFYSMLTEVGWYRFRKQDLVGHLGFIKGRAKRGAPLVNDWAIRNGSCPKHGQRVPRDYACVSSNSYCVSATNGPGYLCNCSQGYEGNPYLHNGCQGSVLIP